MMNSFTRKFLMLLLMSSSFFSIKGQGQARITGLIQNERSTAIPAASVNLIRAKDSVIVQTTVADEKGHFLFSSPDPGAYAISVTAVSFEAFLSPRFSIASKDSTITIDTIRLKLNSTVLSNVVVAANKAPVENRLDKIVVNVSASPMNAGATALEALAKAPGVTVDNLGTISLKGKSGVQIFIDGKATYLSPQDLATLLKGMPAAQLSQIEIMSQPSSVYDAAGNAGMINLKQAKNKQQGWNGSVNLAYSQGRYGRSPNSVLFNFTKNKWTFYTGFSFSKWTDFNEVILTRKFLSNPDSPVVFHQNSPVKFNGTNYNIRGGVDYQLNERTSLGVSLNSIVNHNKSDVNSLTNMYSTQNRLDSTGITTGFRDDRSKNWSINMNFEKQMRAEGRKFTADADYVVYKNSSNQLSQNYVNRPDGTESSAPFFLRGYLPSDIAIYSFKASYVHPFKNNAKLETGFKTSYVKIDNKAPYEVYNTIFNHWVTDSTRADYFRYAENITALYVNLNKELKKWSFQAGLRYEQTHSTGTEVWKEQSYRRSYGQLFPTFYTGYQLSSQSRIVFSYGRRLDRPNYQDMNPFQRFLDKFTYIRGNPFLQPQFTNNFELSYSYKNKITTTFYYTLSNQIINDILIQNDTTKIAFRTKGNIGKSRVLGLSSNYAAKINSWWFLNVSANLYKNHYNTVLDMIALKSGAWNFSSSMNTQMKFAKTWSAEISGTYQSRMLENAIYTIAPRGVISFALAKQLFNNNATITLNLVDPFNLQFSHSVSRYGNLDLDVLSHWDNKRIGISFMYRFKKGTTNSNSKASKTVEEQKRVN